MRVVMQMDAARIFGGIVGHGDGDIDQRRIFRRNGCR